jgi:hypothetical protein
VFPDLDFVKRAIFIAKAIQADVSKRALLPSEPTAPPDQPLLAHATFSKAPDYMQRIVFQINGCYTVTAYDGCAVLMRKLVESLIISCFEKFKIESKIRRDNGTGDYYFLKDLVPRMLAEKWQTPDRNESLGRNFTSGLNNLLSLKDYGDLSAHTRQYNAKRQYIDGLTRDLRVVSERMLYLAGYKQ